MVPAVLADSRLLLSSDASFVGIVAADGSRGFAFAPSTPDDGATALEYGGGCVFGDVRPPTPTVAAFTFPDDDEFVTELGACVGGCGGGTDGTDGDEIIDVLSLLKNNSRFAWICAEKERERN